MKSVAITRLPDLDYACTEALNTLCTNLTFAGSGIRKIMLTSCQPQEGKSFLSINLMRTLAGIGKKVVLIDADLRRSVLESRYGIESKGDKLGLSHYLAGLCNAEDIIYKTNYDNAYMVLVGRDVANSLSLLSTPMLGKLLDEFTQMFDIVLLDVPPVGIIIDAAMIARSCDGVLFVVSDNIISRRELSDAAKQIEKTGCPILGAVLNKVSFDTHSSKKYYYRTYYTHYYTGEYYRPSSAAKKRGAPKSTPKQTRHHDPDIDDDDEDEEE